MAFNILYFIPVLVAFILAPKVKSSTTESENVPADIPTDGDLALPHVFNEADDELKTASAPNRDTDEDLDEREDTGVYQSHNLREPNRRHPTNNRRRQKGGKSQGNMEQEHSARDSFGESESSLERTDHINTDQDTISGQENVGSVITDSHSTLTSESVPENSDHNASIEEVPRRDEPIQTMQDASTKMDAFITSRPTPTTNPCPKCGDKEKQKQLHIDLMKQTLLRKLGLSEVPKVDGPIPPLPFDFYLGDDFTVGDAHGRGRHGEVNAVKTREIFVFGDDVTHKCQKQKSSGCYSFQLDAHGIDPDDVASVELWIYKQANPKDQHIQTFMVSELSETTKGGEITLRQRNIVKRIETRLKYGWMKIYVRRTVTRWLQKPHRNHGLTVVCKTCQRQNYKTIYGDKKGLRPILVFYMKNGALSRRRHRRDVQCVEGGSNCCHKETLEINFRDIGWDYIMAPASIRPNFCTGSCNGIHAAYYNHTRVVQTLQQSVIHDYGSQLQPCCSPVAFQRPQSLLYRDNTGVVRKVDVPDLLVGQCGCT